ncbi:hypothetical protein [Herpetosiphon gulosus]|uniref:Uncharacterized protein n=1 Tax=Herpetosiphon gulosus TaxID=1973496 RepID=A0ABP9WZQ5_9CHLR
MDGMSALVVIIGAVGLITLLIMRTKTYRERLRFQARAMDRHVRTTNIRDDVRQDILDLLIRGDRLAAIQYAHEQTHLDLLEARTLVDDIEKALKKHDQTQGASNDGH